MMIDQADWETLESTPSSGAGVAVRRIAPSSGHDLFVGVRFPGRKRQLIVEVASHDWPADSVLPEFKALTGSVVEAGGTTKASIELESAALNDVFTALANDVAHHVATAATPSAGVRALIERLERWRRLLEPDSSGGMTLEERRGLYGELTVLERALMRGIEPSTLVSAWTGPLDAHQDFQHPNVAIEVKATSTKQPQALSITSERQLDDTGIARLALVHVSLDERAQGTGASLAELVLRVASLLGTSLESQFASLLAAYGWLPGDEERYTTPLYSERSVSAYDVLEGFPRLTEADCPAGVGDVTYLIQMGSLVPFETPLDEILDLMGDPA